MTAKIFITVAGIFSTLWLNWIFLLSKQRGGKNVKRKIGFVVLFFILTTGTLSLGIAPEADSRSLSLPDLVREALAGNPRIKAAENQWKAAAERIPQAKSLPDPMVSIAHYGRSIETRLGPQRNKISVSQKIPFFGKIALKENVARINAEVYREQYEQAVADVTFQVKEVYFTLFWVEKALKLTREEKDVLLRFLRAAEKKYEAGSGFQQDVLKANLETAKVQEKIIQLEQTKQAAVLKMNTLLARNVRLIDVSVEDGGIDIPVLNLEQLQKWALEERPEIKRASRLVEMGGEGLKLARKNRYPDFSFMLDYMDIGGGTTNLEKDGRDAWMGAIGVNIPLFRNKLKAAEAEAALKLEAHEELLTDVKNDTAFRVSEIYGEIVAAKGQLELYEESLIPQAEQSLKSSEMGYMAGTIDFLHLLESERMILQLRLGYFKILSGLGKSLALLGRIVGKSLV